MRQRRPLNAETDGAEDLWRAPLATAKLSQFLCYWKASATANPGMNPPLSVRLSPISSLAAAMRDRRGLKGFCMPNRIAPPPNEFLRQALGKPLLWHQLNVERRLSKGKAHEGLAIGIACGMHPKPALHARTSMRVKWLPSTVAPCPMAYRCAIMLLVQRMLRKVASAAERELNSPQPRSYL